jgi:hypothetical protein
MMSLFSRISIIFAVLAGATLAQEAVLKIDKCREQGFDPMRLACPTCEMLPGDHQTACKACCQSSKAVLKIAECREKGFDPMRLACSICDLLPDDHQTACKACCQSPKIAECREQGFDPMRLACPTCDLLPVNHQIACKACCQSYMDLSHRRTRPYEAAVLVHSSADLGLMGGGSPRSSGSAEIDELLKDTEEWERLVTEKGGEERLQVLKRTVGLPKERKYSQELVSVLMKGGPPAEVLLMDEKLPRGGQLVYEDLYKKAAEVISLQGSSKDDIKDLLMTLLL